MQHLFEKLNSLDAANSLLRCQRDAALANVEKLEASLAKATDQNMAGMLEASSIVFEGIIKGISGGEAQLHMGFTCPYCDKIMATAEEATAHDGVCVKHPAVIRAEKAEAERDVLAEWLAEMHNAPKALLLIQAKQEVAKREGSGK